MDLAEASGMYAEQDQLDEQLAHLAGLLRSGETMISCIQLADFTAKLDRMMRHEERKLACFYEQSSPTTPNPIAKVKREHATLRNLMGLLADALGRADERRALEIVTRLRGFLIMHVAKEESLQPLVQALA